ncbi:MAG TPA: carboxypeptidase regulatory-like domain-containing protein [Terracidiphilus sp.]|nr:carboxypeptidase regulatory-like domain-containing protein [Terracidiphilus sp.]
MKSLKSLSGLMLIMLAMIAVAMPFGMAQSVTAKIVGVIHDPTGAVIPDAQIVATNITTGARWNTKSGQSGEYVLPNLPAGDYTLTVSRDGFKSATVGHIQLQVLQTAAVDVNLEVGAVSENVRVAVDQILLNTQTSDLGSVINSREIQALPLNGGDVLQLATLAPGVNTFYSTQGAPNRGAQSFQGPNFLAGSQNVGTDVTVGISRENSTEYRVDGVNITNPLVGQISLLPSTDDVQEFKVEIATAPANFSSPQSINVLTKGGTNSIHGTAFDYLRNDALDAKNFFQAAGTSTPLRFNQFGATVGGPILKQKLFYFGSYSGVRSHTPATVYAVVPTESEYGGDFNYPGAPTIYDFDPNNPSQGTPFPNNTIPSDRISQFAQVFNKYMPHTNFSGTGSLAPYNFSTVLNNPFNMDQGSGRIDYTISGKDRLFGRYTYANTTNNSPGIMPLYGQTFPYLGHNAVVDESHTFNEHSINVFRFGFTKSELSVTADRGDGTNYVQNLGLSNLAGETNPNQYGLPTVVITDLNTFGPPNGSTPRGGDWNLFQWTDDFTYVRGTHTIQVGAEIQHNKYAVTNPTASRGFFEFLPFYTGLYGSQGGIGLADYLLGYPLFALGDSGDSFQDLRWTQSDYYAQDDWRASRKLTLNVGVRYTYTSPAADQLNHESYFDFSCPCIVTAASGKIHNGIFYPSKLNFAPRVGLAWSMNAKTVLHAGYGIFYTQAEQAGDNFVHNNPPFYSFQFITNFPNPSPISSFFPSPAGPDQSTFFLFSVNPHDATPYYQQWNLGIERQLNSSLKFNITYAGSEGTHLPRRVNANQATLGSTPIQERRPYPQYGDILLSANISSSNYESLQLAIEKRFSRGFSFTGSYVHANGFDYATDPGSAGQDRTNLKDEYGPSNFLVRNRFTFNGSWNLPIGEGHAILGNLKGVSNSLLGGWQVSMIELLQSGTPLTITVPNETNTGGFIDTRANTTCDGVLSKSSRTLTEFFDTSCYSQPPVNTFGNARRGTITGPGLNNTDINLRKIFTLTDSAHIQFDAQFFNAFNHPQFNAPVTTVGSPGFGGINSALSGRDIQFGLKLIY